MTTPPPFSNNLFAIAVLFLGLQVTPSFSQGVIDRTQRESEFRDSNGDGWRIVWGDRGDTPARVFMGTTARYFVEPVDVARTFLQENSDLFSMQPGLPDLEVRNVQTHKGFTHVKFQQTLHGIPIEDATYAVHITPDGRVDMANGTYHTLVQGDAHSAVRKSEAISTAERHARSLIPNDIVVLRDTLERKLLAQSATLVYTPAESESMRLMWKVVVAARGMGFSWTIFLDATDGSVWDVRDNITRHAIGGTRNRVSLDSSNVATDSDGRWDPVQIDSTPSNDGQTVTGSGFAYPTHPDLGSYSTKSLERLDSPVLGVKWYLKGAYAQVKNDAGSEAMVGDGNFFYSTTNTHFQEVNLYYHVDRFRAEFLNPLGLSGYGKQVAHAHAPPTIFLPNAWFDPDNEELYFNDGYQSGFEDFALEDKVIYHEFGHGVNFSIEPEIRTDHGAQEGAISEGVPDYFAAAFTGREAILDYAAPSQYHRDIGDPDYPTLSGYLSADPPALPHRGGELLSSILWDVRGLAQTDGSLVDQLVLGTLYRLDTNPDFEEFRDALLAEDRAVNAGQYVSFISGAFAAAGVGEEEVDNLSAGIGGPTCLGPSQSGTFFVDYFGGVPPYTQDWYYYAPCGEAALPCGAWTTVGAGETSIGLSNATDFNVKVRVTDSEESQAWSLVIHVDIDPTGMCASKRSDDTLALEDESSPAKFGIQSAYPNPFVERATLDLAIPEASHLRVDVYDVVGRLVAVLHDAHASPGVLSVSWNSEAAPVGVYFIRAAYGESILSTAVVKQ